MRRVAIVTFQVTQAPNDINDFFIRIPSMTQRTLERAVAARTGESIRTIVRRGFSLYIPTPNEDEDHTAGNSGHSLMRSIHERTQRPGT
jgi:hypothetical protein